MKEEKQNIVKVKADSEKRHRDDMSSHGSPQSKATLKSVFNSEAKSRMKNLVEKAKYLQSHRDSANSLKSVKMFMDEPDPNDTNDFQDGPPKHFTAKSKLKLKKSASTARLGSSKMFKKKELGSELKSNGKSSTSTKERHSLPETKEGFSSVSERLPVEPVSSVIKPEVCHKGSDVIVIDSPVDKTKQIFNTAPHMKDEQLVNFGASHSKSDVSEETQACQVCFTDVKASDFDLHVVVCLRSKFSKGRGQFLKFLVYTPMFCGHVSGSELLMQMIS